MRQYAETELATLRALHESEGEVLRDMLYDRSAGTDHAALIVEIRANDRPGLLALLTGALERAGVDIDWAKVNTRGSMVDDVFCIALPAHSAAAKASGEPGSSTRSAIEHHLLSVLETHPDAAAV